MTYNYASFSQTPTRGTREFKPTDEQVEIAERRVLAVFTKFGGAIRANSRRELIRLLGCEVHNRGNQLGRYKEGEFSTTLRMAVDSAIKSGNIAWIDGWFGLTSTTVCRKVHRQKYPKRRAARRVA